jgi:hypothetical protein
MLVWRVFAAALCCVPLGAAGARLTPADIAELCANADGAAHCGRLIEAVQLKRLPGLARREGNALLVSLYPVGTATFTDVDDPVRGRSYSLWDALDSINAIVLYTTTNDATSFTLLQRTTNLRFDLPAEPQVSPDRQRLVTADVCAKGCSNEIAVWRVSKEGVRKELAWSPGTTWIDAAAAWKDADTLTIEYTLAGQQSDATLERKLADPAWKRVP